MSGTDPGTAETRCDEDSGSYATCYRCELSRATPHHMPIRCELDAGHSEDEHRCGIHDVVISWAAHVGQVVAERLQAAEVGACGAAGGETGTELPACDSGAQKAARELADFLDRNSPAFDGHRIIAVSPVRTRCDEDSGSYGTCGCPIRCNLDAGHEGEHRSVMLCGALDEAEAERDQLKTQMDEADGLVDAALTDAYVRGCADIRARVADLHRREITYLRGYPYPFRCTHCEVQWPCPTALTVGIGGES